IHLALVAVVDGQAAQTAAADGAGHGAIAQNGDKGGGEADEEGGQGLRQHHLADDLHGGAAHGLGGLQNALVGLPQGGLHQAGHKGEGGTDQGDDGGGGAHRSAQNHPGQGDNHDHEYEEGHGAQEVDHGVEHLHQPTGQGAHAALLSRDQNDAQGQADDIGEEGGHDG